MFFYDGADELDSHWMLSSNLGLEDSRDGVVSFRHSRGTKMSRETYVPNKHFTTRQWASKHPTSISLPISPGAPIIWLNHPSLLCGFFDARRMPSTNIWCMQWSIDPHFPTNDSPRIKLVPSSPTLRGSYRHFCNASSCKSQSRKFGWGMVEFLGKTHSQFLPKVKLEGKWFWFLTHGGAGWFGSCLGWLPHH